MITQVSVGGRQLSGRDRFGDWAVSNIEGWFDTPDRRVQSATRPLMDGEYDVPEFWEARQVTISGRVIAVNHDAMHEAEAWLKGMLARGSGVLSVTGHGVEQWAIVKLASAIKCMPAQGTDDYLRFQLQLKSPDPRKFGELRTFTATNYESVAVSHKGNYWATPKFTVTGVMPGGYSIVLAGRLFTVTRALTSSAPHTIDYRDGRLRVNGSLVTGGVSASDIYRVEPGQRDTLSLIPRTTGTGTIVAELHDTYI